MAEIDHIIPNIEFRGQCRPRLYIADERLIVLALLYRVGKATLDAAQANNHILARRDARRRLARILIGKGADIFVGIYGFDGIGYLIDKPYE